VTTAIRGALTRLATGHDLTADEAADAVAQVIDGAASDAETAAFLTALRLRGETPGALAGAVRAVRARMRVLELPPHCRPVLDTCGTGGDGTGSFNVSTAVAIVAAACGVKVAKHGNRSASGNSGSAEVLAELGVAIEVPDATLVRTLEELGIAFLFAPAFHPALRHAAAVRKQLPFRTLFNLVGPLANPASPEFQLLGVPDATRADLVAAALGDLAAAGGGTGGAALIVSGSDGMDEVTLAGPTHVQWLAGGRRHALEWRPGDFGLPTVPAEALRVDGPATSAARLRLLLAGDPGPVRDVVLANTAAALLAAGHAGDLPEGVARAAEAIDSRRAADLLRRWVALSGAG
jgi:anthranilate phosphoribosyltransferase